MERRAADGRRKRYRPWRDGGGGGQRRAGMRRGPRSGGDGSGEITGAFVLADGRKPVAVRRPSYPSAGPVAVLPRHSHSGVHCPAAVAAGLTAAEPVPRRAATSAVLARIRPLSPEMAGVVIV